MNVLAKRMPLLLAPCCHARAQRPQDQEQTLAQRYLAANAHDRLCLWLQFREARPELDRLERAQPGAGGRRRCWLGRLSRRLGLPLW